MLVLLEGKGRDSCCSGKNDQSEMSIGLGLATFAFHCKVNSSEII